jgi:putative Mn2+ efflux pump MntP
MQTELRILGVAAAIGLDVLALSAAIGVKPLSWSRRLGLGACFASAELVMQGIGLVAGTGLGHVVGELAAWVGLTVLLGIGIWIFASSFSKESQFDFDVETPLGLLLACLSISLDSLGIGFSLPALGLPLVQLFATVAVSTVCFTLAGLTFGAKLGEAFGRRAERGAGAVLILLAIAFAVERLAG